MSRRRTTTAALLLILGAAWVLFRGPEPQGESLSPRETDAPSPATSLLRADPAAESAPTLAGAEPPTSAPAGRGPVHVTVLGRSGQPLRGASVEIDHPERDRAVGDWKWCDDDGVVVFPDVPYDGSAQLSFRRPADDSRSGDLTEALPSGTGNDTVVPVTGPAVIYRARTGFLLDIRTVAAETGKALPGLKIRPYYTWAQDTRTWQETPVRFHVTPEVGERVRVGFMKSAPDGWVPWEDSYVDTTVSPYVDSLSFVYPMRREMNVVVTTVDERGNAVKARVNELEIAGRMPGLWWSEEDTYERLHVRQIPFLPGEILELAMHHADSKDESGGIYTRTGIPDDPETSIDLRVVLPATFAWSDSSGDLDDAADISRSSARGQPPKPGFDNTVVIHVLRHDGSPAVAASVSIGPVSARTDASGIATLRDVEPGEAHVQVWQPGLLPMPTTLNVVDGKTHRLDLREGGGGTIGLSVVDEEGRPLSFASFRLDTISGLPWLDVEGSHQRVDRFVDSRGRRLLRRVEPGRVTVTVTWGSRKAEKSIQVVEGEESTLRVVLPAPQLPR